MQIVFWLLCRFSLQIHHLVCVENTSEIANLLKLWSSVCYQVHVNLCRRRFDRQAASNHGQHDVAAQPHPVRESDAAVHCNRSSMLDGSPTGAATAAPPTASAASGGGNSAYSDMEAATRLVSTNPSGRIGYKLFRQGYQYSFKIQNI